MLDLTHCVGIKGDDLVALGKARLPALKSLSVSLIRDITADVLKQFGEGCPNLKHLCINYAPHGLLNSQGIQELLQGFANLKTIEVWCCESVSLPTILLILKHCRGIQSILMCRVNPQEQPHPCLSPTEFEELKKAYPTIQFKVWHHSITGNRYFQYHQGQTPRNEKRLNSLKVELKTDGEGPIKTSVLVDNIPIWSNENNISLSHLQNTVSANSGAIPLVFDWCCECNMDTYNGVLFYDDLEHDHIIWETHEPGSKKQFRFEKVEYIRAIGEAVQQHESLMKSIGGNLVAV